MRKFLIALAFVTALTGSLATTTTPTFAACANPDPRLLTFPAWYRGLVDPADDNCGLLEPSAVGGISNFIWSIVLNGIEIVLQLIGYIAAAMIIYGGFRYMTNGGNASTIESARKTIIAAAIGLAASTASIGVVNLIFWLINGPTP